MRAPLHAESADAFELTEFLRAADLTTSGIGEAGVHLWVDLDTDGRIIATTGFELEGDNALLRGVAVAPSLRGRGRGTELAQFALDQARSAGATRAWLFSRRSGAFWKRLGFQPADAAELALALASTHQVRVLDASHQLRYETAWSRPLP